MARPRTVPHSPTGGSESPRNKTHSAELSLLPAGPLRPHFRPKQIVSYDGCPAFNIKGQPYLYRREYLGAAGHARPQFRDTYLGRLEEEVARGEERALVAAAKAAARRHGWV